MAVPFFFLVFSPKMESALGAMTVALHRRFLKRSPLVGGSTPSFGFVQIGPNIPREDEIRNMQYFSTASGGNAHWVLVEPQEPIIKDVEASASSAGFGPERTTVINAAMCPSADTSMELWKFKDGFLQDPYYMQEVSRYSTLGGKDVLINTFRKNVPGFIGLPPEQWHSDDIEDWVEPVPVRCHTATTLLKEVRMEAANVDLLFVDAEGYDAEIVSLFGALPGFNPAVIFLEYAFHHVSRGKVHQLPDLASFWSRRGYAIHKDEDNLVIFKTDGS